jgi:hypothetical protein
VVLGLPGWRLRPVAASPLVAPEAGVSALPPERWRPVPGYEGRYEVSESGMVLSLALSAFPMPSTGYLCVRLCKDALAVTRTVHSLVAEAFHGPRPPGHEARHLDGNRQHNSPENVIWGTKSENTRDQVRHGTHRGLRANRLRNERTRT